MITIGETNIVKACLGSTELANIAIGDELLLSSEPTPLPYDAEIEYIRGDGNAYMTIPVRGTSTTTTFYLELIVNELTSGISLFGSRTSSSTRFCWVLSPEQNLMQVGYGSAYYNISLNFASGDVVSIQTTISGSNIDYLIENKTKGTSNHHTFALSSFATESFVYLFWSGVLNKSKNSVKRLWIANNGVKTSDCIPVRVDQTGYLYDKVSKTLLGNAGTGRFLLGGDV